MSRISKNSQTSSLEDIQVLRILGENDGRVEPLLSMRSNSMRIHVSTFGRLLHGLEGCQIVAEDNEDILGTYAMIDPQGKSIYQQRRNTCIRKKCIEVGFSDAWNEVVGFSEDRFENRGGNGTGKGKVEYAYLCWNGIMNHIKGKSSGWSWVSTRSTWL